MVVSFTSISAVIWLIIIGTSCGFNQDDYYDYYDYGVSDESKRPSFLSRPQAFTVEVGQSVIFPCYAKNKEHHSLVFNRDLEGGGSSQLLAAGGVKLMPIPRILVEESRLTISKVLPRDAGVYTCSFPSARDVVLTHSLNVQYPPSVAASLPLHHNVPKGSPVTLQCTAKGNPAPSIRWSRQDGSLPSGAQTQEGDSLTLHSVGADEEGTYICTADNGIGEPASASTTVMVEFPPAIITAKSIVRTGEGDHVELACLVQGRPSPQVSWTRDGDSVPHNTQVTEQNGGHKHILIIDPVKEKDFGAYVCIAENTQGQESAVIQLTGMPQQPRINSPPNGAESHEYTLTFETESYYPIIEYRLMFKRSQANLSSTIPGAWRDLSRRVVPDLRSKRQRHHFMQHTLTDLHVATDYEVVVRVKNKYGWSPDSEIFAFSTRKVLAVQQSTFGNFFSFSASPITTSNAWNVLIVLIVSFLH